MGKPPQRGVRRFVIRRFGSALMVPIVSGEVSSLLWVVSVVIRTSRLLARILSPRQRRPSAHSSCCSARTAPTSPMIEGRFGEKISTPSGRTQVVVTSDGGCRVPVALSLGRGHQMVMIMSSPASGRMSACG